MVLFRRKRRLIGKPGDFFYNVETGEVEEGPQSPGKNRMGPYATREEAERALATASERTSEWESDPKWRNP
ncbi:hypothetical protein [Streptomyces boncukensis]|uniref:SPOR domain-containing protein n=1 Tax=Streptomyces boncukensis TaxID=2711219 RepID=A0A6G4WZT6_9ACTN|nr:hypothetical protein [Streptomyces boncukensis]NGO70809.1 hypothetical protein [Streptomyces boncukensis]